MPTKKDPRRQLLGAISKARGDQFEERQIGRAHV